MTATSKFESRTGKLSCSAAELFSFISDIRNFEQFIPEGSIKEWKATHDQCSFQIPPLGNANIRISEKSPFSFVGYSGDTMQDNKFELAVYISEDENKRAEVRLALVAELNPFLKLMAAEPIRKFMEKLILEMEKFRNWNVKST
jgi:hypothetical protein